MTREYGRRERIGNCARVFAQRARVSWVERSSAPSSLKKR
jgi:hypothetical protein